jgi:flavin-binding protein dodecin
VDADWSDKVRARAYAIREREGRPVGGAAERHWAQAEAEPRAEGDGTLNPGDDAPPGMPRHRPGRGRALPGLRRYREGDRGSGRRLSFRRLDITLAKTLDEPQSRTESGRPSRATISIKEEETMSVARVTEISSTSSQSFEDAIKQGIERATKTLRGVTSAWVQDQRVSLEDGRIKYYQVNLRITFVLEG